MVSRFENIDPIFDNASKYRAIIGSLGYLIVGSRLGVAQSVSELLSRYCSAPKVTHWIALKRLLRYIAGTTDYCLVLDGSNHDALVPKVYVDADYNGCRSTRRTVSGYMVQMCNAAVIWSLSYNSRQQSALQKWNITLHSLPAKTLFG
ncbi:hypothetical protein MP228_005706 [Amoeboaphelidium protococcarum]|nr:hypothetical protein MP228_005706 [Amoeboaphelidium protococcarum]